MPRQRRRRPIPSIVVFVSLCFMAVGAWALSYCDRVFSSDGAVRIVRLERSVAGSDGARYFSARSDRGKDVGVWYDLRWGQGGTFDSSGSSYLDSAPTSSWRRLGFESHRGTATYQAGIDRGSGEAIVTGSFNFHLLAVPYWFILLLLALMPLGYGVAAARRGRRRRRGLCSGCGYDLRASTGRCPECGLRIRGRERQTTPEPAAAGSGS